MINTTPMTMRAAGFGFHAGRNLSHAERAVAL